MQVAKNEFLGGIDRDFRYKALQIHYAMMLENQYTKDQILERYLNTVFFGNNAYGVQAAAEAYFGKTVDQLTFVEAAYLAGLVRSPSGYDPIDNPERSRARFAQVVDLLVDAGEMTEAEGQTDRSTRSRSRRASSRGAPTSRICRARTSPRRCATTCSTAPDILGDTFQRARGGAVPRRPGDPHDADPGLPADGRAGPRPPSRDPAGLRRGDGVARHEHRGDRGDGRRARVRARRERGQHGPRPTPDGFEPEDLHPRRRPAGRAPRPTTSSTASRPCVLPNPGEPERAVRDPRRRQPRARLAPGDDVVLDQLCLRPPGPDRRAQPGRQHDVHDGQVAVPLRGPAGDRSRPAAAVPGPGDGGQPDVADGHGLGSPDDRQRGPAHGAVLRRVHRRLARRAGRTPTTTRACRSSIGASPSRPSTCSRAC